MRLLLITLALGLMGSTAIAQTKATRALQANHENDDGAKSAYLYQSTLRALNVTDNEALDELIRGVEKITVFSFDSEEDGVDDAEFQTFIEGVKSEGYHSVISMSSPEQKFAWYAVDGDGPESFVAILKQEKQLFVADLQGKIDIRLLYSLKDADLEILKSILEDQGLIK